MVITLLVKQKNVNQRAQSEASLKGKNGPLALERLVACCSNTTSERKIQIPAADVRADKKTPDSRPGLSRSQGISSIAQRPQLNRQTSCERIVCTYFWLSMLRVLAVPAP
jgi:hypothetical protein